jgi:dienelactone hydrolase
MGVWIYDVAAGRFSPWAVSPSESPDLPVPITVRYPTFDSGDDGARRMIPALVFAAAPEFSGRRPVMIDIPVARPCRWPWQRHRTMSSSDGRARRLSHRIGALLDWIATQSNLDPERVAVSGGSYGGCMTLASLVHYSDRFRCGFELFGINDFVTFLQASEDSHYPDAQRAEFGDERDPATRAFLESISPVRRAERIRVPLLIFQGANDVRVKPQESRQMVERIRAAGGAVTYVEAADEGHGFEQPLKQLYIGALAPEFMERYVGR